MRSARGRSALAGLLAAFFSASAVSTLSAGPPGDPRESNTPTRDEDGVLLDGSDVPDLDGRPIAEIALFRYNAGTSTFEPIPFQIDERVDQIFNAGTPLEFTETMYDILHEEDGRLDANDLIVFLFGDAGAMAPPGTVWPEGSDAVRYEIQAIDTRPNGGSQRWVYLFTGPSLPRSPVSYVSWNLAASGTISTERFALDFSDRWLLTGFRVQPPCGSGADLIDRVKGRAVPIIENDEDEEGWNNTSSYLGGILGPIRAIRYVRGAASGVNTIHHDIVYRGYWRRTLNLRVHPIAEASLYIDWRPTPSGTQIFTPLNTGGAPLDGHPDGSIPPTFVDWTVVRHSGGGMVALYDVPASPLYSGLTFTYRDEADFDDRIPENPGYSDEDHAAYGNVGVRITGIADCNINPIRMVWRVYPTCAGVGDAVLGDGYHQFLDYPFQTPVVPQWKEAGPVRTLRLRRDAADVVLDWQPVEGATSYLVYTAAWPDLPVISWTLLGETAELTYRDAGAAGTPDARYYSVVGKNAAGTGPW